MRLAHRHGYGRDLRRMAGGGGVERRHTGTAAVPVQWRATRMAGSAAARNDPRHPTGIAAIDRAVGFVPLSLWLPYALYRRSHLAHHRCGAVTDRHRDPESRYHDHRLGLARILVRPHSSLVGQMLIGPPISICRALAGETARLFREPRRVRRSRSATRHQNGGQSSLWRAAVKRLNDLGILIDVRSYRTRRSIRFCRSIGHR